MRLPRGKRGPPPAKGDRVYSFHMLVARPGTVGYFLAQSLDKPSSDSLGRFALKVYAQPAPARLAFTSGRKLMELGQFTPLRVNKERLELALGSFDSRACASAKTPDDKD